MSNITLCITRDLEWEEWQVHVYIDGKHSEDAMCFTDDLTDAKDTMWGMRVWYESEGHNVTIEGGTRYEHTHRQGSRPRYVAGTC
jgi:hypothetical protein